MSSRLMAILAVLVLAAGCATPSPSRTFSTEAEVRAAYGEPVKRWPNDDGTTALEYSNQPNGYVTMMYTVDAGGMVVRQEDVLAEESLARIERGMTQDEVARRLGRHRSVQTFVLSGEEVWDWNIRNYYGTIATLFNVHFVDGKVVRTSRSYIYPYDGNDHMSAAPFFDPFPHAVGTPYAFRSRWYRWPRYPYYSPWYFY
jgi:hypothetical protein